MAFHKREPSRDITSNATPLPTYYSQQLPRWTSKSAFEDQRPFDIKTKTFESCYPQYTAPMCIPMPRFDEIPLPPRPQPQRTPRKAFPLLWFLASIFFLLAFWLASIALGVRLFMALQPGPSDLALQEIRIILNEDMLRGSASAYTALVTLSANKQASTAVVDSLPAIREGSAVPTTTSSQLHAAPTPFGDPLEGVNESKTGAPVPTTLSTIPTRFITVARA